MIDKTYQPTDVEPRISQAWEQALAFRAGRPDRADAKPYCIVIPPPNVTGSLHMGHALNNTLQDILCRFERMRGRDVLWQPGTDHAGIATQMVVERQLMERQLPGRRDMGREKFLERVWEWKAESGGTIVNQLKRLGASCDWSRERFTMDEGLSRAVLKVFVELYRAGLIYKDKRLVNWDPKLLTAISDLEVVQVEVKGSLWHLRYPLEGRDYDPNNPDTYIVVATTRPETMLGDVAVAVHPTQGNLHHLIGRYVILPLVGRRIPIVGDDYADPEKGTGAVKITPAHDFNDFEVGRRHNLPPIGVFSPEAKISIGQNYAFWENTTFADEFGDVIDILDEIGGIDEGGDYVRYQISDARLAELMSLDGLDRSVARKRIVELLSAKNLVEKIEPHQHAVPHGDRSNVVIEPFLTEQWYVDAKELAKPAIAAVREGTTSFVPKTWEKTYFEWMEKIQPWCVSRQLWWGHQIPAWYGHAREGDLQTCTVRGNRAKVFVADSEIEAVRLAEAYYQKPISVTSDAFPGIVGRNELAPMKFSVDGGMQYITERFSVVPIERDEDVLDTWFSSALWPFSTLGWPDETPELKRYYPTDALVTGFDIIFFWVARMMMMGLHLMKEVPFHTVYIHRLVRDQKGAKMSKSKGNVIDPLGIINEYGADALRFTLARGAALGHDIKLATHDVETNRNFATKIWNAARFAEMNQCVTVPGFDPRKAKETLNRWIAHETARTTRDVTEAIEAYRFNEAANAAYRFVWNIYCDWYLELAKPVLTGADGPEKDETRAMVAWARDEIVKLLHPFMPFITEELWWVTGPTSIEPERAPKLTQAEIAQERPDMLALTTWPSHEGLDDDKAEAEIGWVVDLITVIRSLRSEMNIPPATLMPLVLSGVSKETQARASRWLEFVKRLARVSEVVFGDRVPEGSVQFLVRGKSAALPLKGVIDLAAESVRLQKELAKAESDIARVDQKLGNPKFVANAAEDVVEGEKEKREEAEGRRAKILEALERLKGAA